MSKFDFESNAAEILAEFAKQTLRVLYAIGTEAQSDVILYMSKPDFTGRDIVDTGRLRASISFLTPSEESGPNGAEAGAADAIRGRSEIDSVLIGSNVEYADEVNNGGYRTVARHFLENGIEPNGEKYKEIAAEIYEGKL